MNNAKTSISPVLRLEELEDKFARLGKDGLNLKDRQWLNKHLRYPNNEDERVRVAKILGRERTNIIRSNNNDELVAFIKEHNRFPHYHTETHLYSMLMKFKKERNGDNSAKRNDPETFAFLVEHGFNPETKHRN